MTVPPARRNLVVASQAGANGATPLWITPQMSVSHTSRDGARPAMDVRTGMGGAEGSMRHA